MTTHSRSIILSLAVIAPIVIMPALAADRSNSPAASSADAQSRKGDDTQKTGDKAVKRDKDAEKKQKEADKKQKEEARRRADADKKREPPETRSRDGKDGDARPPQRAVERPQPVRRPPHVVDRNHVVFVGGYFYDPYFGEYPWWPPVMYPHQRIVFEGRAQVRLQVTPRDAAVYVDGFYAGVVDDFDGFFQRLPLPPGGHTIALYREGFGTIARHVYLSPGSDLTIREVLVPLPPGQAGEPPMAAALLPPPPEGSYMPPRTASRNTLPAPAATASQASIQAAGYGVLSLRFRPSDAVVTIDGEEWITTLPGELVVHLSTGVHVVQLKGSSRAFTTQVEILENQTTELNVGAQAATQQ